MWLSNLTMAYFITFHYKGKLMSHFKVREELMDGFLDTGNELLIREMRNGRRIEDIGQIIATFAEVFHHRRTNHKKVAWKDHLYFSRCFLALQKLGFIQEDNENGLIITKMKRKCKKR